MLGVRLEGRTPSVTSLNDLLGGVFLLTPLPCSITSSRGRPMESSGRPTGRLHPGEIAARASPVAPRAGRLWIAGRSHLVTEGPWIRDVSEPALSSDSGFALRPAWINL